MDWGGSGLKRTNSDEAMSSMIGEDQSFVWTNEKHNSYIESLEASFVQQLHHSIGRSHRYGPDQRIVNTRNSDEFTALRDGCRKMLKPKYMLQMDATDSSIREKLCVRNFRSSDKQYGGSSLSSGNDESGRGGNKNISHPKQAAMYYDCYHNSSDSAEFSGQNFIDEQKMTNQSSNE